MNQLPLVTDVGPVSCSRCRRSTNDEGRPLHGACLACHPRGVPCAICGTPTGLRTFGSVCSRCYIPTDGQAASTTYGSGEPDPMAVGLFAADLEDSTGPESLGSGDA